MVYEWLQKQQCSQGRMYTHFGQDDEEKLEDMVLRLILEKIGVYYKHNPGEGFPSVTNITRMVHTKRVLWWIECFILKYTNLSYIKNNGKIVSDLS